MINQIKFNFSIFNITDQKYLSKSQDDLLTCTNN